MRFLVVLCILSFTIPLHGQDFFFFDRPGKEKEKYIQNIDNTKSYYQYFYNSDGLIISEQYEKTKGDKIIEQVSKKYIYQGSTLYKVEVYDEKSELIKISFHIMKPDIEKKANEMKHLTYEGKIDFEVHYYLGDKVSKWENIWMPYYNVAEMCTFLYFPNGKIKRIVYQGLFNEISITTYKYDSDGMLTNYIHQGNIDFETNKGEYTNDFVFEYKFENTLMTELTISNGLKYVYKYDDNKKIESARIFRNGIEIGYIKYLMEI